MLNFPVFEGDSTERVSEGGVGVEVAEINRFPGRSHGKGSFT